MTYQTKYFCCSGYSPVGNTCKRECSRDHKSVNIVIMNALIAAVCSSTCKNSGTCASPELCQCVSGWTGSQCATRNAFWYNLIMLSVVMMSLCNVVAECDPGCATKGGTCTAPFTCLCPAGLSGSSCQTGMYIN